MVLQLPWESAHSPVHAVGAAIKCWQLLVGVRRPRRLEDPIQTCRAGLGRACPCPHSPLEHVQNMTKCDANGSNLIIFNDLGLKI